MTKYTAIDAFCGAGGLSIGLSKAGFDVRLGFDSDSRCIETMQRNPELIDHPVLAADVREITARKLLKLASLGRGQLDLLAGGPPCQGFSVQRTIGEDRDERNLLVHHYGDLVVALMPRFFLVENVPGIGGKRGRETLSKFLQRMRSERYFIHERVLDAQDFGVPQRRRRYVLVGELADSEMGPVFDWPVSLGTQPVTVRDAIADLPSPPSDGTEHPEVSNHRADRLSPINRLRMEALKPGESRVDLPDELLAECHKISAEVVGHRNVYGRMAWDDVAPTITARFDSFTRGKFGHPTEIRSISLREGARLQTFPDCYVFHGTKVEVARQIGNAVPPLLAEAIGGCILDALSKREGR